MSILLFQSVHVHAHWPSLASIYRYRMDILCCFVVPNKVIIIIVILFKATAKKIN